MLVCSVCVEWPSVHTSSQLLNVSVSQSCMVVRQNVVCVMLLSVSVWTSSGWRSWWTNIRCCGEVCSARSTQHRRQPAVAVAVATDCLDSESLHHSYHHTAPHQSPLRSRLSVVQLGWSYVADSSSSIHAMMPPRPWLRYFVSVCPHSEIKTTWAINIKLGRHTMHGSRSASLTLQSKGQRSKSCVY